MLKKMFAFGLLTVGTLCSVALGASANEAQIGVQTIESDNTAIHGVAVTQNEQDLYQNAVDGYDYFYAPDTTVQTGVQSIDSYNTAIGGVAVTQNDQDMYQGAVDGYGYGYGYNPFDVTAQTGAQVIDSSNAALDGVAVTQNEQILEQFAGF
ncbi:MAG: hypothetical protein ACFCVD_10110 [Nodosilinea sp.]